jgi:hypothetical protein
MLAHVKARARWTLGASTVALACFACNAERPTLTDAGAGELPPCTTFADELVAFTPGDGGPSDEGEAALGAPDGTAVTVALDATLTVAFLGLGAAIDEEGDDIRVHATPEQDASAVAYVSDDGIDYRYVGDVTMDTLDFDLAIASASSASYFRVVGTGGAIDVDAIEILTTSCQ